MSETPSVMDISGQICRVAAEAAMRHQERVLKHMLGGWVSGLEPVIVFGPNHRILGLSAEGHGALIYLASPDARAPIEMIKMPTYP